MDFMFDNLRSIEILNLSSFHTPKLKSNNYMFNECSALKYLNLGYFDGSLIII